MCNLNLYNCICCQFSSLLFPGLDVGEIEVMRSKKMELEESVSVIEESLGSFKNDLRYLEEEAAKFHKQRVC